MKRFNYSIYILLFCCIAASCKKTVNDDVSLATTGVAPSDFAMTVAVSQGGVATITPTASGVAFYNVYFGDNTTTPATVLPGKNVTHGYTDGTYTVKCVAKNLTGDSSVLTKQISVSTSQLLVDFEATATTYPASVFGGCAFAKVANPSATGINTSANVGKITKGSTGAPSETWAGITMNMSSAFSFTNQGKVKMKIYSNHTGAVVKFKLENPSTGTTTETDVLTTVANGWEELTFNMDASVIGRSFGGFSIFYEFGLAGNGSANFIGYFDDIKIYP